MDFAKTTLAVALGIILVPILICGGCLFIGGIGTTAVVGTGIGATKSIAEAVEKANEERSQQARQVVSADEKRFANESASYEAALRAHEEAIRIVSQTQQTLADWIIENPKPERPIFGKTTWWALGKGSSIEATLINVNDDSVKLEKSDGSTVVVPIEKLANESRDHARESNDAMQAAVTSLAGLKRP